MHVPYAMDERNGVERSQTPYDERCPSMSSAVADAGVGDVMNLRRFDFGFGDEGVAAAKASLICG